MSCSNCGEGAAAVQALPVQVTNAGDCPCLCGFREQVHEGCASVNVRPTSSMPQIINTDDTTDRLSGSENAPPNWRASFVCRQKTKRGGAAASSVALRITEAHTVDLCHAVWKTSTIAHNCPETGRSLNSRWQCGALSAGNHCGLMQNCTLDWFQFIWKFSGLICAAALLLPFGVITLMRHKGIWLLEWLEGGGSGKECNLASKWEDSRRRQIKYWIDNIEFEYLDNWLMLSWVLLKLNKRKSYKYKDHQNKPLWLLR